MVIAANLPSLSAGNRVRDAAGVLAEIEMLIKAITPEWTDLSDADPGVALAQVFAYLSDHNLYQVEQGLHDATLMKGSRRTSALLLARALGYEVDGPVAASTTLQFTLTAGPLVADLTIPKGFQCQGSHAGETVVVETDENLTIPAGTSVGSVGASEGSGVTATLDTSNGEPYQIMKLGVASVIQSKTQKSVTVKVDGTAWTNVTSFAKSKPDDQHYMVLRDDLDRLSFVFGDGLRGAIPGKDLVVTVDYRVGGGRQGNVPIGTIKTVNDAVSQGGNPIDLSVTNLQAGVGGLPRETLTSIQRSAPAFFAAQDRAVTGDDFTAVAAAVTGVSKAKATRVMSNMVEVRLVPTGWAGDVVDAALKASVDTELEAKRMITDRFLLRTADPLRPLITLRVTAKAGHRRDAVKTAVIDGLKALYAIDEHDFGGTDTAPSYLRLSDMIAKVDNTFGVDFLDVTQFTRRPLLLGPKAEGWDTAAGNATFGGATMGADIGVDTWTIEFTSATAFKVHGDAAGHQVATGTVGSVYTTDDGQLSFTVTAGATAMAAGNKGRFKTSKAADSIPYTSLEHPVLVSAQDVSLTMLGGI